MEEDLANLRSTLAEWIAYFEPVLANVGRYTWDDDDASQFWQFLRRGIIIRQHEALQSTLQMVEEGHGHFAVTFLRPAYEELIWVEYIQNNISLAPDLPLLLGRHEVGVSLSAQNEHLGKAQMAALGFSQKFLKTFAAVSRRTETEIRDIRRRLGWPQRNPAALPSMWFLSRKVGREKDYKFLYHATSRLCIFRLKRSTGEYGAAKVMYKYHQPTFLDIGRISPCTGNFVYSLNSWSSVATLSKKSIAVRKRTKGCCSFFADFIPSRSSQQRS